MRDTKHKDIKPKQGFIYKFRNNGKDEKFKFDYSEFNAEGNEIYIFINLFHGNNTKMTPDRFCYKWRFHNGKEFPPNLEQVTMNFNSKNTVKVAPGRDVPMHTQPVKPASIVKADKSKERKLTQEEARKELVNDFLKRLNNLTLDQKTRFNQEARENIDFYICKLKNDETNVGFIYGTLVYLNGIFNDLNIAL